MCPFDVGVVHGPSAGRAGKPRTYSGRRPRPSRGRCDRWLSTDGHGPRPAGSPRTRPICWLRRSSWPWMQWLYTVSRTATLCPAWAAIWAGPPPAFSHSDKAARRRPPARRRWHVIVRHWPSSRCRGPARPRGGPVAPSPPVAVQPGGTDCDRLAGLYGDGADRGERRHTDRLQGARADPVQRAWLGRQVLPVGYA